MCETVVNTSYEQLQHFISNAPWSATLVQKQVAQDAASLVGDGFVQGMTARIDGVDIGAISVTDAQHASVTIPASALTLQNPAPFVGTGQVTTTFAVVTAQVANVVFAGVPSSIVAGAALPAFTVTDQYGNLVDTPNISFFNSSSKPDKS